MHITYRTAIHLELVLHSCRVPLRLLMSAQSSSQSARQYAVRQAISQSFIGQPEAVSRHLAFGRKWNRNTRSATQQTHASRWQPDWNAVGGTGWPKHQFRMWLCGGFNRPALPTCCRDDLPSPQLRRRRSSFCLGSTRGHTWTSTQMYPSAAHMC